MKSRNPTEKDVLKGILCRICWFLFVNNQFSKLDPPPILNEWVRLRAAMAEWAREWTKTANSTGENKTVTQIHKTLFSDCLTVVMFYSTNKHAHASAQPCTKVLWRWILCECRASSLPCESLSPALGQVDTEICCSLNINNTETESRGERQWCKQAPKNNGEANLTSWPNWNDHFRVW